jgi:hypothetical protein
MNFEPLTNIVVQIECAWRETSPRLASLQRTGHDRTVKDVFHGQWNKYVLIVYTDGTYTFIEPTYNAWDSNVLKMGPVSLRVAHNHGLATEDDLQPIRELEERLAAL